MWNLVLWDVWIVDRSEATTTLEKSRDLRIVFRLIDKFLSDQETDLLNQRVFSKGASLLIELYHPAI